MMADVVMTSKGGKEVNMGGASYQGLRSSSIWACLLKRNDVLMKILTNVL